MNTDPVGGRTERPKPQLKAKNCNPVDELDCGTAELALNGLVASEIRWALLVSVFFFGQLGFTGL